VYKSEWRDEFPWIEYDSKNGTMYCIICKLHGGTTAFAKEGSKNFKRTALADHGSSKHHTECLERSFMKQTLEKMKEKLRFKAQLKNMIILKITGFISKNNIAIDKFEILCRLIEDIIDMILPGESLIRTQEI
jgi:hypothetical protein